MGCKVKWERGDFFWWPHLMTSFDDFIWWPLLMTSLDDLFWWPLLVTSFDDFFWWSHVIDVWFSFRRFYTNCFMHLVSPPICSVDSSDVISQVTPHPSPPPPLRGAFRFLSFTYVAHVICRKSIEILNLLKLWLMSVLWLYLHIGKIIIDEIIGHLNLC